MAAGLVGLSLGSTGAFAANAAFATALSANTTGFADSLFIGAPDGQNGNQEIAWVGIGNDVVIFDFEAVRIIDGVGADLNIYEVDFGGNEFFSADFAASQDGINFFSLDASLGPIVPVDNDPGHTNDSYAQSFDLAVTGLEWARYVRVIGLAANPAGGLNGFDLDAAGAVNFEAAPVPVPAAAWLFGSALAGLATLRRRRAG